MKYGIKYNFSQATQLGYSTGAYHSFNLATHTGDDSKNVGKNRKLLAEYMGITEDKVAFMNQIHGNDVQIITNNNYSKVVDCDAIITDKTGILLNVLVADCVPVLLYDVKKGVIAAAHAGRRGTAGAIMKKVLEKMSGEFGACMEDIYVLIGPSIALQNYEIGADVYKQLKATIPDKYNKEGVFEKVASQKYKADLKQINRVQAQGYGVREENIIVSTIDTYSDKNYFSARRQGLDSGRCAGSICLFDS